MTNSEALQASNPLGTLRRLRVSGFTVFSEQTIEFAKGVNVIVGENGTGKSHLLRLAYAASKALYPTQAGKPLVGKEAVSKAIAEKLIAVFLPDSLGRLCRRGPGRQRAEVALDFSPPGAKKSHELSFSFSTNSVSAVVLTEFPEPPKTGQGSPIFLPTREIISLLPEFVSTYLNTNTRFDETYYDLALSLVGGLKPGKRPDAVNALVDPLEKAMDGKIYLEHSGRVYLKTGSGGNIEMPLLAEGLRKVAMLAFLILNGSLARHGTIYWDEPETNLNPKLMTGLAKTLVDLASKGAQVIVATHSLFLTREIAYLLDRGTHASKARYFSLVKKDGQIRIESADHADDLADVAVLEAAIDQDTRLEETYWQN